MNRPSVLFRRWSRATDAVLGHTRKPARGRRTVFANHGFTSASRHRIVGLFVFGTTAAALCTATLLSRQVYAEPPSQPSGKPNHNSTAPLQDMPTISYDCSDQNIEAARAELVSLLGTERVDVTLASRIAHSSTAWSEAPRGDLDRPSMVVMPRTTEEVSKIAQICHRRRIPMIGYSGGTSLEGTLAAIHGGVCIDFKLMNNIVIVHKDDLDVVVQPAVGYEELNDHLASQGLFFPPDPGPGAQIGGMISQGCSGTNAYRYGTVKDWVLGLTVVLADGTIVKTRHRPRKSSSGYNLTQLMVGSEGTLGLVTEASLKLTKRPENVTVALASFPTVHKAVETAVKIVQDDMQLAAMELLCDVSMRAVNLGGYCDKEYEEVPTLFLKFAGSKQTVTEQIDKVQKIAGNASCKSFEFSTTDDEADAIWAARKTVLWSIIALKNDPSDQFLSADTAVPISRLADAVETARSKLAESGFITSFVGHLGDGNFHTAVLYPAKEKQKAREMIREVQRLAISMDGTVTGEHGIGLEYREMVVEELGQSSVDLMRQVKLALDPLCLLNPDKLFKLNIEPNESSHTMFGDTDSCWPGNVSSDKTDARSITKAARPPASGLD